LRSLSQKFHTPLAASALLMEEAQRLRDLVGVFKLQSDELRLQRLNRPETMAA
jgi:hypothetical protein